MNKTITEQLVSELSRVNSTTNQKGNTTMTKEKSKDQFLEDIINRDPKELTAEEELRLRRIAKEQVDFKNNIVIDMNKEDSTMNENQLTIEQVTPIDLNTHPFTIEVNTNKETPTDNKKSATPKATKNNTTNNKEKKTMTNAPRTYSRFAYQDELVDALAKNDITKVRDILSWGPAGKIADKVKMILYLHPNKERDEFLMASARLLSLDYKLSDGSINQEWIRLAASLIGKDTLDADGNVVRKANSRFNYLMDKAQAELPLGKKIEDGFIHTMDIIGKGISILGASGTGIVGNFIAQSIASAARASIEIDKAILSSKITKEIDPELVELRALWAQIEAMKKMAADAQDKDSNNGSK